MGQLKNTKKKQKSSSNKIVEPLKIIALPQYERDLKKLSKSRKDKVKLDNIIYENLQIQCPRTNTNERFRPLYTCK